MSRTIMAVGGHIGDAELTAGPLLAKCSLQGDKIVTVALTGGEKGNPPHLSVSEYRKQKIEEANKFADMLGGEAVVFPYADGELPDNDEVRFMLCDVIRKHKPSLIITHWKNSIHKDHKLTSKIVLDAQFYAGLASFERELPAHWANGPYYAENWEDADEFKPYIYVDVTEGFDLWKKAVSTHWFVTGSKSFKYLDYYDHLQLVRGHECRRTRAITFDIESTSKRLIKDNL